MKNALFGATGRTGVPFVQQALVRGHVVRAAGRDFEGLGIESDNLEDLLTEAAKAMVSEMESEGPRRVVVLTGAGVRYPTEKPALLGGLESHTTVIMESSLDWTLVRPPMVSDR